MKNPEVAIAWFLEKRDAGEFDGKGIKDTDHLKLEVFGSMMESIAKVNPERAIELYEAEGNEIGGGEGIAYLANKLVENAKGRALLGELMTRIGDESVRKSALLNAIRSNG